MVHMLRHFMAEFVGTFALVFVGGAAIMMMGGTGAPPSIGVIGAALAHGLILAVMVSALMRISGHFNPAVSVAFFLTGRLEGLLFGIYLAAQIIGSVVATLALKAAVPAALFDAARGGGQSISIDITGGQAFLLEAIATFFLVFVVFGTAVDEDAPKIGGLGIGLTLTAAILAIGPLTGGSLNPARSFGPAAVTGIWEGQVIYWAGPLVGGAVAGLLYHWLFLHRGREPVDHGAVDQRPTNHRE